MKKLFPIVAALSLFACARPVSAPPAQSVSVAHTASRMDVATIESAPTSASDARMLSAISATAPTAKRVRVHGDLPAESVRALERAGFAVGRFDQPDVTLCWGADVASTDCAGHPTIKIWSDTAPRPMRAGGSFHAITPLADGRFEHIEVASEPDEHLARRFFEKGFWPASSTGLEVLRVNADGTRDVRAVGYLNPYADDPAGRLSIPVAHLTTVMLESSPAIANELRTIAKSDRGKMVGPLGSMTEQHRSQTNIAALGTCAHATWITGASVSVAGRMRFVPGKGIVLEVSAIEASLPLSKWLPLQQRYDATLRRIAKRVAHARMLTPDSARELTKLHEDVRKTYPAAALFEVDAVLHDLVQAFTKADAQGARDALSRRCRRMDAEEELESALAAL